MSINAIETSYAGCRFRSRLEARWAVFFDTLGIPWEYEPQGVVISCWGEDGGAVDRCYLPDFWLPHHKTHVEVKGTVPTKDYLEMISMGVDYGGPLGGGLLLLGPIPDVSRASVVLHSYLYWRKGVVHDRVSIHPHILRTHDGVGGTWGESTSGPDWPETASWDAHVLRIEILGGGRWYPMPILVKAAYEAARSARFEHGETPNVRSH